MTAPESYPFLTPDLVAEAAEGLLLPSNAIERFKEHGLSQGESMIGLVVLFHLSMTEAKARIVSSSTWSAHAGDAAKVRQVAMSSLRPRGPSRPM